MGRGTTIRTLPTGGSSEGLRRRRARASLPKFADLDITTRPHAKAPHGRSEGRAHTETPFGLTAQRVTVCTTYTKRMTQALSFRADESLAEELDAAAAAAGVPRSDLLNQAVREFLYRLRCERDAERYALHPLTAAETAAWPDEAWPDDHTDWTEVFGQ